MPYYRCPACGLLSHSVAAYSTAGVCANCSAALPDDARLEIVPQPALPLRHSVGAGLAAPARARRAMSGLPIGELARQRLSLVVSELVSNAVRHAGLSAGDPIKLEVTNDNGSVWVSVHDGGPGFKPTDTNLKDGARKGLAIVDSLADDWGVDGGPEGCTVWCAVGTAEGERAAFGSSRA